MKKQQLALYKHPFKAMGSPCQLQFYAKSEAKAKLVIKDVVNNIERLENRYSRYRDTSFLQKINRTANAGGNIKVDAETAGLLNYAATCYDQSGGLFDITSGVLRKAWNFKENTLPTNEQIQALIEHVGWYKLHWSAPVLEFPVAGMEIDFGGIVKEYAVDRTVAQCRQANIYHGFVNLGGDIGVIGPHPDGGPWIIAIRDPRQPDQMLRTIELTQGGLASSGDYERCIQIEGVRYGHILNPKTGWPVAHIASVSVISDLCMIAGSASTIGMLKADQGPSWLKELGLPHLWVDVNGQMGGTLTNK